jgi:hypothetical protein
MVTSRDTESNGHGECEQRDAGTGLDLAERTMLEGTTKGPLPNSPDYIFSFNAAGRSSDPTFSGFGSTFIVGFYDGLLGQHGTWTFEISYESGQESPWVFHFTVP